VPAVPLPTARRKRFVRCHVCGRKRETWRTFFVRGEPYCLDHLSNDDRKHFGEWWTPRGEGHATR
jgi:hypothetical protein